MSFVWTEKKVKKNTYKLVVVVVVVNYVSRLDAVVKNLIICQKEK